MMFVCFKHSLTFPFFFKTRNNCENAFGKLTFLECDCNNSSYDQKSVFCHCVNMFDWNTNIDRLMKKPVFCIRLKAQHFSFLLRLPIPQLLWYWKLSKKLNGLLFCIMLQKNEFIYVYRYIYVYKIYYFLYMLNYLT